MHSFFGTDEDYTPNGFQIRLHSAPICIFFLFMLQINISRFFFYIKLVIFNIAVVSNTNRDLRTIIWFIAMAWLKYGYEYVQ